MRVPLLCDTFVAPCRFFQKRDGWTGICRRAIRETDEVLAVITSGAADCASRKDVG